MQKTGSICTIVSVLQFRSTTAKQSFHKRKISIAGLARLRLHDLIVLVRQTHMNCQTRYNIHIARPNPDVNSTFLEQLQEGIELGG